MTRIGTRATAAALIAVLVVATPGAARVEAVGAADVVYSVDGGMILSLCVEGCVIVGGLGVLGPQMHRRGGGGAGTPDLLEVRVGAADVAEWGIPIVAAILSIAGAGGAR